MNRNRFKNRSSTKVGQLNISVVSGNGNKGADTSRTSEASTSSATSSPTSSNAPAPSSDVVSSPTAHKFRVPQPSPKTKSPVKRTIHKDVLDTITKRRARRSVAPTFDDMEKPLFERVLTRCQFHFKPDGDTPHILDQEQIFFVCEMQEQMEDDPLQSNVDDFMEGFIRLHENDPRLFKKSLMPTKASEASEISGEQDSLIHLLLEVQSLQIKLMTFLFDKLVEHVVEEGSRLEGLNEVEWSRLILKQMCNLTFLVDSEYFTKKLLEMLEIAIQPVQKIFLQMLPRIIYDDQQQEVAKVLSKLMKEGGDLTPQLLDSLASLTTSRDVREGIMESVLAFLKSAHRKFLPQVITFLLMETQFADDLPNIVQALRRDVDLIPIGVSATQQAQQASIMVKVVAALRVNLNSIGEVGEVWLNAVSASATVTMLDLAVLTLLYSQGDPVRCKAVLGILRTKSSAGAIKEQTVKQLLQYHGKTLGEKLESLLDIASHLMQYPDRTASHHGALWFKLMFLNIEGYKRQQVMYRIIMIVGLCSPLATQNALWVLSELVTEHLTTVLPHAALLMSSDGLLERVESVALEHARKIMDVLCRLAYSGDPSAEALQADISILIKKQLSCPQLTTKRKGIVGAVMAIKHIAVDEDEMNNSSMMESGVRSRASVAMSDSGSTVSLPAGHRCHAAQDLINLVRASTIMYPEINGFFYDELASMASDQDLDHRFLAWLTDLMVNVFQEEYIVEDESAKTTPKEVKMTPQFGLDGEDNPIVANIGEQILKAELAFSGRKDSTRGGSSAAVVKPYVICPLFRLVRILKFRTEDGSLEDIDALLGCALQLPEVLQNLTRGGLVSIADPLEQRVVLNSLFLTINWFREVVNAFAVSGEPNVVQKVIQRVRHIVYLENKLAELLPAFPPDYNPPACQFYADVLPLARHGGKQTKKKKKGRRKKKVAESSVHPALDQSDNELSEPEEEPESEEESEGQVSDLEPLRACLREIDITLFVLLSKDFKVRLAPTQGAEVTPELGPAELVFFLEDLSTKLDHALVAGAAQSAPKKGRPAFFQAAATGKVGQPISAATPLHYHLDMFPCEKVARNMARMTKHMCNKLQLIVEYFQSLEDKNDGVRDGPGSDSEYSKQLSRCFLLLLRTMKSTIAWNGFYTPEHSKLLLETLRELASRVDEDAKKTLLPGVVSASCQFLSNFGEFVLQLPSATALISLMQVVASHDLNDKSKEAPKNRAAISQLCKQFLTREWPAVPRGSAPAPALTAELVQAFMDSFEVRLLGALKLLKVIDVAGEQLKGKNALGHIEEMPTVNKNTLAAVYKVLATNVVSGSKEAVADPVHMTQTQGGSKLGREMQAWTMVINGMQKMVSIAKYHETTPLLTTVFKHCLSVLRLFLDRGMPVLDKNFRHHPEEVTTLLKDCQKVTRFLQNLCNHSKLTSSLGMVQLVPSMKYLLEKMVHRTKSMLMVNGCAQAFWMGNLKNRNLKGEEISSQMDEEEVAEENGDDGSEEEEEQPRRKKRSKEPVAGPSGVTQRRSKEPQAGPSGVTQKSQRNTTQQTQRKGIGPTQETQQSRAGPASKTKASDATKKTQTSQATKRKGPQQTSTQISKKRKAESPKTQKKTQKPKLTGTQKSYYRPCSPILNFSDDSN